MRLALWCVVALLTPALALAGEGEAPVWWGDVRLWEIVASVIVAIWGIVKIRYRLSEGRNAKATGFLEMGVQRAYDEFVRAAKAQAPEGKLTDDQVRKARDEAWKAAKGYAADAGFDLVKEIAAEQVPMLLTKIVSNLKKKRN